MRRIFFLTVLTVVILGLVLQAIKAKIKDDLAQPFNSTIASPSSSLPKRVPATGNDKTSLFVPYWTVKDADFTAETYDSYLYFGITPTAQGIDTTDVGYLQLDTFSDAVPEEKKKLLVLRLLDADTNTALLKDTSKQKTVILETIATAQANGFDGVVLDLELSAIPFESLVAQIREMNANFFDRTKAAGLSYGIAIYGDTFYRLRPFDVKAIAKKTDMIYVMAYDFHKSRSNPGPNFPLSGTDTYGYDISTMSEDFLRYISADRLTIVFGFFGYDWQVDSKEKAIGQGEALTYKGITKRFLNGCDERDCLIKRDKTAGEIRISYTDEDGGMHIVWFEDSDSVASKQEVLRLKGINNFSFWASGYF